MEELINIEGEVKNIRFQNAETGFYIFSVVNNENPDGICVLGNAVDLTKGSNVVIQGKMHKDPTWGEQIKAISIYSKPPSSKEGIIKYLLNKTLFKGLGEKSIEKLVNYFGSDTILNIIDKEPDRLREVSGIPTTNLDKFIQSCKNSYSERKEVTELAEYLIPFGITSKAKLTTIMKLFKDDVKKAIKAIQKNPYILYRAKGIGFLQADVFAKNMGILPTDPDRIRAGIHYVIMEATSNGDCAVPKVNLFAECQNKLGVGTENVIAVLDSPIFDVVVDRDLYYASSMYKAEVGVVAEINRLLRNKPQKIDKIDELIRESCDNHLIELSKSQEKAVKLALSSKIIIITGGPGCGKTTSLKTILDIYQKLEVSMSLASPTGRAAKRASEVTGIGATSIHRLLGVKSLETGNHVFNHNEDNQLTANLIVIDEVSMVDMSLMYSLLRAIPDNSKLLLIGDVDQLPSVGPGSVLQHLIESERIPVVELTEIFRQAAESKIIVNAHKINKGLNLDIDNNSDFIFLNRESPEEIRETLLDLVGNELPSNYRKLDLLRDLQILTPMHKGLIGVTELNKDLQQLMNPNGNSLDIFDTLYRPNDKIMQLKNNYTKMIFNGDIGYIISINKEEKSLLVHFNDELITLEKEDLKYIKHAYASTIHKSQGSEYDVVIIICSSAHYVMLSKNLLYTAVTRGKKKVILIGDTRAIHMAISTTKVKNRISLLKERLIELKGE